MQITMQQLAYIRKLQFKMQTQPSVVLDWAEKYSSDEEGIKNHFVINQTNGNDGLVSFYGAAVSELDEVLPVTKIRQMLNEFCELKAKEKDGEDVKQALDTLTQLEPVYNLKNGVVANMVGVIAYMLEKFNYNAYISLEDLSDGYGNIKSGTTEANEKAGKGEGCRADVEKYAGLGLYNFFETQLLRKLFRLQKDGHSVCYLIPPFRAQKNYDKIAPAQAK